MTADIKRYDGILKHAGISKQEGVSKHSGIQKDDGKEVIPPGRLMWKGDTLLYKTNQLVYNPSMMGA